MDASGAGAGDPATRAGDIGVRASGPPAGNVPGLRGVLGGVPALLGVPGLRGVLGVPGALGVRGAPGLPGVPETPGVPDAPGTDDEPVPSRLGLVRLRLALALLAAAAIPIAISLALPLLLGAGRPDQAQTAKAAQAGNQVSTALTAELERDRSALLLCAANTSAVRLAAGTGSVSAARADLQPIATLAGAGVPVATVVDASGTERLRLENGQFVSTQSDPLDAALLKPTLALRAGQVYRSAPFNAPDGTPRVAIAAPLVSDGHAVGVVRFDLSLQALLAGPQAGVAASGGYSLIVATSSGSVVADARDSSAGGVAGTPQGLPAPDQLLSGIVRQAGQTWTSILSDGWSVDYSPLGSSVPGFGDLAVVVAIPAVPAAPPIPLLALFGLLVAVLVALAAWMAHEVLQPAVELDRSHQELSQRLEVARHDALHDSLTGLGNHRSFYEELDRQLQVTRRYGVPVALLLIDLDDFKHVNDTAGHAAGDAVLASVGAFLNRHIRATDRAFRIGGDEFAVVMPHTDMNGGLVVAHRLLGMALEPVAVVTRTGAADTRIARTGAAFARPVSFSAGVSAVPVPAESRAELYAQADAALLWCKRHGRTTVAAFDPT